MTIHTVRQGECLASIALAYGFRDHRLVYDHPDNAAFRRKRPDPNVLHPGDRLVIPVREPGTATVATGAVHRFVLHVPRRPLHLVFRDDTGEALAGIPFELTGPGVAHRGETDGAGAIRVDLPLGTTDVQLTMLGLVKHLRVGHLDPVWDDERDRPHLTGIQARLANLGFAPGAIDGVLGPRTARALRAYQRAHGLPTTGQPSRALAARLESDHGC
jgi:N-acetylmuramoyl-L-alanine amidase